MRLILLSASLMSVAASFACAQAQPDASTCRFTAPPKLPNGRAIWLGPCRNGRADGSGAIRMVAHEAPVLWFGPMTVGTPGRGVVSRGGVYYPEGGDDRAENVRVFRAAAAGARGAAAHFAAQKNAASARFYRNEAIKLERTLD